MGNILGFLTNARIKAKLFLLLGVSIGGFVLFALFSFSTLNELKVNGKLYKRIVQGKDLIADVLPPRNTSLRPILSASSSWMRPIPRP